MVDNTPQARDRRLLRAVHDEMGVFFSDWIAGRQPMSESLASWVDCRAEMQARYPGIVAWIDAADSAITRARLDPATIWPMDMAAFVPTMERIMAGDIRSVTEAALAAITRAQSAINLTLATLPDTPDA